MHNSPVPSKPPLSIAVIGAGAIGSAFAYCLARAGHDVTIIARPSSARLGQLRRDGGIVHAREGLAKMRVADLLDEQSSHHLVLVTTLAHQADHVLPALQRSQAQSVQFMFNNFEPERMRDAVGRHRVSFGMPFIQATLDSGGQLNYSANPGQKTLHGDARWVALFGSAGIPSAFERYMPLWLRCHVPICISMESICVAGQRRGGGASWRESMVVARGMRGGYAVLRSLGYRLYPSTKSVLGSAPTFLLAGMLWLVSRIPSFRALLAGGVHECRALIDVMVAATARAEPAVPAAVTALLAMKPATAAAATQP